MKIGVELNQLSEGQVHNLYGKVLAGLLKQTDNLDSDQKIFILHSLLEQLEEADGDDMFGTEGWKHYFGLFD